MKQEKIRNVAIIAHVDHGKTKFVTSLLSPMLITVRPPSLISFLNIQECSGKIRMWRKD